MKFTIESKIGKSKQIFFSTFINLIYYLRSILSLTKCTITRHLLLVLKKNLFTSIQLSPSILNIHIF